MASEPPSADNLLCSPVALFLLSGTHLPARPSGDHAVVSWVFFFWGGAAAIARPMHWPQNPKILANESEVQKAQIKIQLHPGQWVGWCAQGQSTVGRWAVNKPKGCGGSEAHHVVGRGGFQGRSTLMLAAPHIWEARCSLRSGSLPGRGWVRQDVP